MHAIRILLGRERDTDQKTTEPNLKQWNFALFDPFGLTVLHQIFTHRKRTRLKETALG